MNLRTGMFHDLTVKRESPFGYFLSNGEEDVLLHYSEMNNQAIEIDENLKVYLYNDHKGRVAATLYQPKIVLGETAFLEVKDFQPKMGFFLDNGIKKQVLLPIAELPEDKKIWPKEEDQLLVKLVHDKQDRLLAALVKDDTEIQSFISKQSALMEDPVKLSKTQFIDGIVLRHLSIGAHIYLENHQIGFLHKSEQLHELRLGERIKVRPIYIHDDAEDKKVNLSMKPLKQVSRKEDAEQLLEILKELGGAMPYWDKTPPDIIKQKFHLSKAAFKRALGKLMKDGLIYQEEGWTYLKDRDEL